MRAVYCLQGSSPQAGALRGCQAGYGLLGLLLGRLKQSLVSFPPIPNCTLHKFQSTAPFAEAREALREGATLYAMPDAALQCVRSQ